MQISTKLKGIAAMLGLSLGSVTPTMNSTAAHWSPSYQPGKPTKKGYRHSHGKPGDKMRRKAYEGRLGLTGRGY